MPKSESGTTSSLNPLSGDISRDLSPMTPAFTLSGDIEKDLAAPNTQTPPQTQSPVSGQPGPAQGLPPDIQRRFERPFGLPRMPVAPASLAAPGAGILGSMLGQGVAGAGEALVGGKGPLEAGKEAAKGAVGGAVGAGAAKLGERALSPAIKSAFEGRTGRKLATLIQDLVPAWKGLPKNAKGLYEMAHGEGENLLDATFKGAKGQIPAGHMTEVPVELAAAAKIQGVRTPIAATGRGEAPVTVRVPTRDLVDNLPTLRAKGRGLANDAWNAIDRSLEGVPGQALQQARAQYRQGKGWIEFAEKGNFLKGEKYDAAKAMAALDKHGKELLSRGMQGVRETVRGPLANPITSGNLGRLGTGIGALGGALAGHGFGVAGEAGVGIGGGYLGHMLGKQVPSYGNVPAGAVTNFLKQLAPRLGATVPGMVST